MIVPSVYDIHMQGKATSRRRKVVLYSPHYLRAWREDRGMVLEDVAEAIDLTHQQLGRIERRLQPWSQGLLEALARVYKVPIPMMLVDVHPDNAEEFLQLWAHMVATKPKHTSS